MSRVMALLSRRRSSDYIPKFGYTDYEFITNTTCCQHTIHFRLHFLVQGAAVTGEARVHGCVQELHAPSTTRVRHREFWVSQTTFLARLKRSPLLTVAAIRGARRTLLPPVRSSTALLHRYVSIRYPFTGACRMSFRSLWSLHLP